MESGSPVRRVFIEAREIPGLVLGALRGNAAVLRRLLGARRAGRIGLALALGWLLLTCPRPDLIIALILLHVTLTLAGAWLRRAPNPPGWLDQLRLSLWMVWPLLCVISPLTWIGLESILPAVVAILAAQILLWRGLAKGLS